MRAVDSPLWAATRQFHHAAEAHPIGKSMADGTMRVEWWADWLAALHEIHSALDPHLPAELRRVEQLEDDMLAMVAEGHDAHTNLAAFPFADKLRSYIGVEGAAYVFTGAHLMGGAITERAIGQRLPCAHLRWDDRAAAIAAWQPYRSDVAHADDAVRAFRCVLGILVEIYARHPPATE